MRFSGLRVGCAVVMLIVGSVSNSHAATGYFSGTPWQVGDIIVCFGNGTCNVLRINDSVTLLDQFSDGLASASDTRGVAINNTLHALVTDSIDDSTSDVTVFSIASVNPRTGTAVAHKAVSTFTPTGPAGSGNDAQAVVVDQTGHIFIGNAGSGGGTAEASIIELNFDGSLAPNFLGGGALSSNPLPLTGSCAPDTFAKLFSMDLSADGSSMYFTSSGGNIQKLNLSAGTCTAFASFGSGVTLHGIKDIPAKALGNVSPSCNGVTCPPDEAVLVVAIGFTDPEVGEGVELANDPDAVNICTNKIGDSTPVSCALLIDTNPSPGLTASLWQGGTAYALNSTILDPFLEIQKVFTAGTSGSQEPTFVETGTKVEDNAVEWTESHPTWHASPPSYSTLNELIIDTNPSDPGDLQKVMQTGVQGPAMPPIFPSNFPAPEQTTDGLVWQDDLGPVLQYRTGNVYDPRDPLHTYVEDTTVPEPFVWKAIQGGTAGTGCCDDTHMANTPDNTVTWMDEGQQFWQGNNAYANGALIVDPAGHVQSVAQAGTSGPTLPMFNDSGGPATQDGLIWADQGLPLPTGWLLDTAFFQHQIIADNNSPQHFQEVVIAGTSGGSTPTFNKTGGYTLDNSVVWLDLGQVAPWKPNTSYPLNAVVQDLNNHVQQATQAGTSGAGPSQPSPAWSDCTLQASQPGLDTCTSVAATPDNVVLWTDEGVVNSNPNFSWTGSTKYSNGAMIVDVADHAQQATQPGSGVSSPAPQPFKFVDGGTVQDNTVTWTDEGKQFWQANAAYTANTLILDAAGHVQEATQGGISGPTQPPFSDSSGPAVADGLIWTDQGQPLGPWQASTAYSLNQIILDTNSNHFQQVVVAGTSGGGPSPTFNTNGSTTLDNTVVWIDLGLNMPWAPNTSYALNTVVLDLNNHVQRATQAGKSGAGPNQPSPAWNDCTLTAGLNTCTSTVTTNDNVVLWTDEGALGTNPAVMWQANTMYAQGAMIIDNAGHVQEATQAGNGTSGASPGPTFVDGGTATDGLIWAFVNGPVSNYVAGQVYSPLTPMEKFVLDTTPAHDLQEAIEAGTANPATVVWHNQGVKTIDNAVIWSDIGKPMWAPATYSSAQVNPPNTKAPLAGTFILDSTPNHNLQIVTKAGTTGPSQPSALGHNPWSMNPAVVTIDGLQWFNSSGATSSVVARYPVTGVNTIQSLALDPIVTDCSAVGSCSSLPLPPATTSNFWLGDSQSPNFYKLDFATGASGSPAAINANGNQSTVCPACASVSAIQGLDIYGSEGSNQPDLTKLFSIALFDASPNKQQVQFPLPTNAIDTNSMTVALFPTTASPIPLSIYASQLPKATSLANGGNNSGATDPPGSFPCEPTTSNKANCILWKIDAKPPNTASLATKFSTVNTTPPTIDTNTDVFVDENYDVTTFVGNFDPGGNRLSVHSLNEVASFTGTQGGSCVYKSPAPKCFQNPGNITFKFSCPTFTGSVGSLQPVLSLVTPPPGTPPPGTIPQPITLVPTDSNPPNYRFDGTQWVFNWQSQNGTFRATTVDETHQIQTFYEDFTVASSCSSTMTVSSIAPNTGSVRVNTKFTLNGTGFAFNATVAFVGAGGGSELATSVKVASNGKSLTGVTPTAANAGPVDIVVSNPGTKNSATLYDGFTYTLP